MIFINLSDNSKTFGGIIFEPNVEVDVDLRNIEEIKMNPIFLANVYNSEFSIDGATDSSSIVTLLFTNKVTIEETPQPYAFAKKQTADGKKLYRRKHGKRTICPGNQETIIEMIIPYGQCKVDEVEVINCSGNDCVDLMVLDTDTNAYSSAPVEVVGPNYILNQFGFDVCTSDLYYSDSSNYDADLYIGMKIQAVYKNNEIEDKNIGVNFVLHEVI